MVNQWMKLLVVDSTPGVNEVAVDNLRRRQPTLHRLSTSFPQVIAQPLDLLS